MCDECHLGLPTCSVIVQSLIRAISTTNGHFFIFGYDRIK